MAVPAAFLHKMELGVGAEVCLTCPMIGPHGIRILPTSRMEVAP